jgi:hypothetical protein
MWLRSTTSATQGWLLAALGLEGHFVHALLAAGDVVDGQQLGAQSRHNPDLPRRTAGSAGW